MSKNTVTGNAVAWLNNYTAPSELREAPDYVVQVLHYASPSLDMVDQGWVRVGKATITVELLDENAIVQAKVDSLRGQQKAVAAKAESINTKLEGEIQNLLAIGFDAPTRSVDTSLTDDIPF